MTGGSLQMTIPPKKCFWLKVQSTKIGFSHPISPSHGDWGPYSVTWDHMSVPAKWHLIPFNDVNQVLSVTSVTLHKNQNIQQL